MITEKNTILKITAGKAEDGFSAEIVSENIIERCTWCVRSGDGEHAASGEALGSGRQHASGGITEWNLIALNPYFFAMRIFFM
mgnify:CR=1 FL=1